MKKLVLIISFLSIILLSWCDTTKNISSTDNTGDISEINLDIESFELLNGNFAKDKNNIYYYGSILTWVDSSSFNILWSSNDYGFWRDINDLYVFKEWKIDIIKVNNPNDFNILNEDYLKDKDKVYYYSNDVIVPITGVDFQTFEIDNSGRCKAKDKNNSYYCGNIDKWNINKIEWQLWDSSYIKDKDNIYFWDTIITWADLKTFSMLFFKDGDPYDSTEYAKDKNHIYFRDMIITGADLRSFKIIDEGGYYAKDKNHIYYHWEILEGADPVTFSIIEFKDSNWYDDSLYAKDKNNIYYYSEKIIYIDVSTLSLDKKLYGWKWTIQYFQDKNNIYIRTDLGVFSWFDKQTFEILDLGFYEKDKNNVYYYGQPLESVDIESFQLLSGDFAKDKNNIYYYGNILTWVDINSFNVLNKGNWYVKDKDNVFYYEEYEDSIHIFNITWADSQTFQALWNQYAKDKNYAYFNWEIIK